MYRHILKTPTARLFLTKTPTSIKPFHNSPFLFNTTRTMVTSISDKIKHDHEELKSYYQKIKSSTSAADKTKWQNQFVWELARHSVAEELIVYPAFEKYLPGGEGTNIAAKDREEHQAVKRLLYDFQSINVEKEGEEAFEGKLDELWGLLSQHILEEERDDLPVLESAVKDESAKLAKEFDRTKWFVPTKSHPSAGSEGGVWESVMGLLGAPVDKLMDRFKSFPEEGEKKM
ncbi:hypothetical protein QBC38DRAFT_483350 [Podospora fimiseda]|uniref:Hemerythrin-like domain-containing protein n=1 Tax=Podospora fimiseda TaxID=252190 RepID=A0AAN7BL44_9PEZI|nr:hypothetical protein QBC38DRAFT_483350 [Podospora fimiseda]